LGGDTWGLVTLGDICVYDWIGEKLVVVVFGEIENYYCCGIGAYY
jgi:hypothetical protein